MEDKLFDRDNAHYRLWLNTIIMRHAKELGDAFLNIPESAKINQRYFSIYREHGLDLENIMGRVRVRMVEHRKENRQ